MSATSSSALGSNPRKLDGEVRRNITSGKCYSRRRDLICVSTCLCMHARYRVEPLWCPRMGSPIWDIGPRFNHSDQHVFANRCQFPLRHIP